MGQIDRIPASRVELFPAQVHANALTEGLERLLSLVKTACPEATFVSFDFEGKLRVHIDVRSREDVAVIERILPSLGGGGKFYGLSLGATPHHPFHHRISALVDC